MTSVIQEDFALCICTFRRTEFLKRLLQDMLHQTMLPGVLIIVDGDPSSDSVPSLLKEIQFPEQMKKWWLPSNHANLPYQRYLGWLALQNERLSYFIYLDDDLRIKRPETLSRIIEPLTREDENVVGVTTELVHGLPADDQANALTMTSVQPGGDSLFVKWFGAARNIQPGGLSPSGHRRMPISNSAGISEVNWLTGGVMAYAFKAMFRHCFSEDLFAVYEVKSGKGEDTLLSRRVGASGKMYYLFGDHFEHPGGVLPVAYSTHPFQYGFALAYSRRMLNDDYRPYRSPLFSDRVALVKSYFGTAMLNWWRALKRPGLRQFQLAAGYSLGALQGLLKRPSARTLTPQINWQADALAALSNRMAV